MAVQDHNLDEGSLGLLEMEPSFSSRALCSKRRAQPVSPIRFLLAAVVLLAFGYAAFLGWTHGEPILAHLRKSHRTHQRQIHLSNGTIIDEAQVVRPLYGNPTDTEADRFDLVASIYFITHPDRFGNRLKHTNATFDASADGSTNATASPSEAIASVSSRLGWERIFSEPVLRGLNVGSVQTAVAQVVLPGRIVHLIQQENPWATPLVARFHLIPSASVTSRTAVNVTHYLGKLTDPQSHWMGTGDPPFPLPYPAIGSIKTEQNDFKQPWESRIPGSPATGLLRRVYGQGSEVGQVPLVVDEDGDEEEEQSADTEEDVDSWADLWLERQHKGSWMAVATRSTVSLMDQSPVYSLPKFRNKMRALKQREVGCIKGTRRWETCTPTFVNRGHFENLLEVTMTVPAVSASQPGVIDVVRWRYPPYLLIDYGQNGPKDYANLTDHVETALHPGKGRDFAFDWHISFSPVSPFKLALAEVYNGPNRIGNDYYLWDFGEEWAASEQDQAELLGSVMGHRRSPGSRLILRFVLFWLVKLSNLLALIFTAYFWYSRAITTGISLHVHALDTLVRLVIYTVRLVQWGRGGDWYMVPAVAIMTGLVWTLCARLEWVEGGPEAFLLVGLKRRRATRGERASAREDEKLTWMMRAGIVVSAALVIAGVVPFLPAFIKPTRPIPYSLIPAYVSVLRAISRTSAVHLVASQLHLNQRLCVFGGNFRLVAYLELASALLTALPVVLSGWWGRWEAMPEFGLIELGWVVGRAALAWQAWKYPRVEQTEPDEE